MKRFKTQWDEPTRTIEKNSGKSETIPDQTLTVMQLVQNHTIPNLQVSEGNYHDPTGTDEIAVGMESGRKLHSMDISEVHDELKAIEEREMERKEKDKKDRKEKAQKILKDAEDKRFKEWQEKQKPNAEGD